MQKAGERDKLFQGTNIRSEGGRVFMMSPSDQELLARISGGNGTALSEFYDRHSRLIYGFVLGMLHDTDEAEDVVQEIFVQVWRKASTFNDALGSPKNWLVRIARNRTINVIRAKRVRENVSGISIPDEDEPGSNALIAQLAEQHVFEDTVRSEETHYVKEALAVLPEEHRYLLDLAFFQGYSHSEIAELTLLPLGTVKTRIRSALSAMRANLAPMKAELS